MIPIGDSARRRRTPYVNYLIVAATVLAFLFELSLGRRLDLFVQNYGVVPVYVTHALAGDPRVPRAVLWTLITSLFLHAGWAHLLGNMLFLWIFGDNVEDRLGHLRYLLYYLLWGVGASLAQVFFMPDSRIPLIGASGAIAGVLGAYIVMYPRAWVTVLVPLFIVLWPLDVPAVLMLGVWFLTQLASGVASITEVSQATGGVAFWAHVAGFVLGAVLTPFLPKTPEAPPRPFPIYDHTGQRRVRSGAMGWPVRLVSLVWDLVSLIVILRILLVLVGVGAGGSGRGWLGAAVQLIYRLSEPLVEPFTRLAPAVRFDGFILELYSLLALLFYYLATTLVIWLLRQVWGRRMAGASRGD